MTLVHGQLPQRFCWFGQFGWGKRLSEKAEGRHKASCVLITKANTGTAAGLDRAY